MTIQKQGWLQKQGGFVKSWKKRWMVLYKTPEKQQISYYSDQGRTALKGTIDLNSAREVRAVPDNEKRFIIITPDRTWRLEALDHPERSSWIEAVRVVLAKKGETEEEEEPGVSKKNDSVMGPKKIDLPGEVPEKNTMQPGTAIQVLNGKVSDAGLNEPLPEKKRDPAAANQEEEVEAKPEAGMKAADKVEEMEKNAPEDFDKVFRELCALVDENHDDIIRLKEFSEMYPIWAQKFFSDFFKKLDKNMDDGLSKSEFRQIFELDEGKMDAKRVQETIGQILELKFDKIFDDVCLIIDTNYDDKFDFHEFAELHPEASHEFFKNLDLNKDKFLSKAELKEYYRQEDGTLDTPRVTKDYAMLEENIYQQDIEKLSQMVDEDHAKNRIDIREFKGEYPAGTKVFIAAVGGIGDEEHFNYEDVLKAFRDEDGWGDFLKVRQVIKDMKNTMFKSHFDGLCTIMDKDHDQTLNVKEFAKIYRTASDFFFKQLDTNNDSKLQKEELREMFVLADGSMDVERMAQIESDMKEKVEEKNAKVDDAIDGFLDADEKDALSPAEIEAKAENPVDDFEEFEEPAEKTPEKKTEAQKEPEAKREPEVKKDEPVQPEEREVEPPKTKPAGCCIIS